MADLSPVAALYGVVLHQTGLSFQISVWLPALPTPIHLDQCCAISTSPIKNDIACTIYPLKKVLLVPILCTGLINVSTHILDQPVRIFVN